MASNTRDADAPLPDSSLNLARWCLERHAEDPAHCDDPALTFARRDGSKQRWTYAEAWGRVQRLARGLLAGGLEPGDRVFIRLSPTPDTAFAFFGATLAGLVAVPAGPPFTAEMAAHLADEVGALALVTTWELRFEGFQRRDAADGRPRPPRRAWAAAGNVGGRRRVPHLPRLARHRQWPRGDAAPSGRRRAPTDRRTRA